MHNIEEYLSAYLNGAGISDDPKGPLFRTIGRGTGQFTRTPLPQANAWAMIERRRQAAGIDRQSQLSGNRDHGLFEERRHAREGGRDGEPCIDAHDAALRPTAGRDEPRRD